MDPALVQAARQGHADVVKLLIADPRVQIDGTNEAGGNALSLAAGNGHLQVVKLLVAIPNIDLNKVE